MEIVMKHKKFLVDTCRAICALCAFVFIAGTSVAPGMAAGGDMHGSMTGMTKNMESMKMSEDTDRDFATMMKIHHQGAIDMARMELQSGKDRKMRAMAKRIIEAQQKEIK